MESDVKGYNNLRYEGKKNSKCITFFNITEYPNGVTRQPPRGSLTAVPSNRLKKFMKNQKCQNFLSKRLEKTNQHQIQQRVVLYPD